MKSIVAAATAGACFVLTACATGSDFSDLQKASSSEANAPDGVIRALPMPSAPLDPAKTLQRIVFASCAHQNEDQAIWDRIAGENPDLVLFIGDNVYGDVRSNDAALPELKTAYMRLAQSAPFSRVRAAAPVLTVWDDHDYGLNDAGAEFQHRKSAEALFNYVWDVDEDDPRRAHEGVYGAWLLGEETGRIVQVILLDTRSFRSPLKPSDDRGAKGKERYLPDADDGKTMLGDAQWSWLSEELKKPADLRLLVSSVQVIADGHGWEAWKMLPAERTRLYQTISAAGADNLIMLSGDRHSAAFYKRDDVIGYPLFEATSSSLNLPASRWRAESGETYVEPGPHRLGEMVYDPNYGVIEIDWSSNDVDVTIRSGDGAVLLREIVDLDVLR